MDIIKTISESVYSAINEYITLNEMGLTPQRFQDKFGDVLSAVADNLICICLYPDNPTISHWRGRTYGLCKRFVDLDIAPIKKNKINIRLKYLNNAVNEIFNNDFSALYNHFKSVAAYYAKREDINNRIFPYNDNIDICYQENKDKIQKAITALVQFTVEQNYNAMIEYMNDFPNITEEQ